ncbi:MAG: hypothetical protein [Caudoviricetes sp.]|nr:MAG: hypothetical protein [Caudoviricetes sp.]
MNNVRASDPLSSVMAAEKSALFSGKQRERIMAAFSPGNSLTAKDISRFTKLTVEQVCRRLPELQAAKALSVVLDQHGKDLMVDGYRVWRAV